MHYHGRFIRSNYCYKTCYGNCIRTISCPDQFTVIHDNVVHRCSAKCFTELLIELLLALITLTLSEPHVLSCLLIPQWTGNIPITEIRTVEEFRKEST